MTPQRDLDGHFTGRRKPVGACGNFRDLFRGSLARHLVGTESGDY